jgi:hypothetical protein
MEMRLFARNCALGARKGRLMAFLFALTCLPWAGFADDAKAPDFSKGSLCGRVIDAATGKPVAGATVALRDKDGKVVAWSKTNEKGEYLIAADSLSVLNLRPSRRRGLLDEVVKAVGTVVTLPVKAADAAVKAVKDADPVKTAGNLAVTAATGNPLPVVKQAADAATNQTKANAEQKAKEAAVKSVVGERQAAPLKDKREKLLPGEVMLACSAPNYKDLAGKAGTFWLDAPTKVNDIPTGPCAWMETIKLAPISAADKKSEVEKQAVLLSEARLEPNLVPAGGTAKLSVKVQTPPGPQVKLRVFAREDKKRQVVELKPGQNGVYSGELVLDPKTPAGDTKVAIVALREEPFEVKLPKAKQDPLAEFVKRLDDLDPDKPYEYDPKILASENRLDVAMTILDPKQGTPTAPDGKK